MAPQSSPEWWQRLEQLFQEAVELSGQRRADFVAAACGEDSALRAELESLLASAHETNEFIEAPLRQAVGQWSASKTSLAPGSLLGHYEVISLLGSGGMGRVYLARDGRLGRKVALKILAHGFLRDERVLRRFEQEARAASSLNHPNILTIFEIGELDGIHFIASEFVNGPTLRERLRTGPVPVSEALSTAIQIATALQAAHTVGVTHRDIKPENVILREDGLVKVVDFGIAKLSDPPSGEGPKVSTRELNVTTQPGMVVGTARYMSPEQARGLTVDGRTDIFSLGTVIYEMVSGKAPFEGATYSDVLVEVLKTDPKPLDQAVPAAPPELGRIVSKAMHKELAGRYQNAGELLTSLHVLQKDLETGTGGRVPPVSPVKTRRKWLIPVAFAALLLLLCGYWLWRGQARQQAPPRSLAILPFRNIRQDPATDFLGFSLADAIITKLGYVSSLTVRPSSAIDAYRNQVIDPRKVGAELNVDTLLTGSFLQVGDDLRINAQLVDLRRMRILWEEAIDIKYEKLLTVQDHVAQKIISGLELSLEPLEDARLKSDHPINQSAYVRYLRGVDLYATNEFDNAIQALEQSAAMEPNYALTWAHLGRAYTTSAGLLFGGADQYRKAQAAYEKALALNPDLIEAKVYMANLLTDTGRAEQAVPLLRAALSANPNVAEAHWELGYAYRFGGMLTESVRECERARQLDPKVKINSSAFNSYFYLGDYDRFLASLPDVDAVYILFYRGFGEYYKHDYSNATAHFDRAFELNPALLPAEVGKSLAYGLRHQNAAGIKLLQEAEARMQERGVADGEGIYKVSQAYAELGDADSAVRMLRLSIERGFYPYPYFQSDPLLKNIRGQHEFTGLMEQARQRYEQFRAKFADGAR